MVRLRGKDQVRSDKSKNWRKGEGDLSVPVQSEASVITQSISVHYELREVESIPSTVK